MHPHDTPLCACGCGTPTKRYKGRPNRYVNGHNVSRPLEALYDVDQATGCHIWRGWCHEEGYALWQRAGEPRTVHKALWVRLHGPVPPGHDLHHTCERRNCINVAHLVCLTKDEHQRLHHTYSDDVKCAVLALAGVWTDGMIAARIQVSRHWVGRLRTAHQIAPVKSYTSRKL
jgi:hypothetical protein